MDATLSSIEVHAFSAHVAQVRGLALVVVLVLLAWSAFRILEQATTSTRANRRGLGVLIPETYLFATDHNRWNSTLAKRWFSSIKVRVIRKRQYVIRNHHWGWLDQHRLLDQPRTSLNVASHS
jgi:hypothetical protein